MAITEAFQNSATISTTEYYLAANSTTASWQTSDGWVQLMLDLNALAAGDVFRIRAYERISSGGTTRIVFEEHVSGPVATPMWITPVIGVMHGWDFSLTRIAGSDRSIAWSIRVA